MKRAYIKPIYNKSYNHTGVNGEIIGVKYVNISGIQTLCYEVDFLDLIDYIPFSDIESGMYKIVDNKLIYNICNKKRPI